MLTPVLVTKLLAPVRRPTLVARPRLTGQLDATLEPGQRLTLVSAPAGFGKTSALAVWLDGVARLDGRGRRQPAARVAWLSLDEGDNDLGRLLTHLVAALDRAGMVTDPAALAPLPAAPPAAVVAAGRVVLTALVNSADDGGGGSRGGPWVVVLDDYHVIASADVHETVAFLLDHLPDGLHVVVLTRSDPPLPVARLRARGQLVEVRAADLRFTLEEAEAFLNTSMRLALTSIRRRGPRGPHRGMGRGAAARGALPARRAGAR